jgi:Zn-dependent peptidase ImmA (M78 family)
MSTTWKRLAGDTSRFAIEVEFQRDPDAGQTALPEESASWGALRVWVDGRNLCEHFEAGDRVESVHWYLLPFLEWLVQNWDALLHEERLPMRNAGADAWSSLQATSFAPPAYGEVESNEWESVWWGWWRRHCLRACRDGGLFPDVAVRRWRDQIEVSWGAAPLAGAPEDFRFTSDQGVSRQEPVEVANALYDVLREASAHLAAEGQRSERLRALERSVSKLKAASARERRLVWLAGLGTQLDSMKEGWQRIRRALSNLKRDAVDAFLQTADEDLVIRGSCQAALMFGTVSPTIRTEDVKTLAGNIVGLYGARKESSALKKLVRSEALTSEVAWEQGYKLASALIDDEGLLPADTDFVDIEALLKRLGIARQEIELTDETIRGVAVASPKHQPAVLVNRAHAANQYPSGTRFTVAHELCHILFDRSAGRQLALASGPWAPPDIERRANAFAAMLLMPNALIRKAMDSAAAPEYSFDWVVHVAQTLRTSVDATIRHLRNLGYLDDAAEQHLRLEFEHRAVNHQNGGA